MRVEGKGGQKGAAFKGKGRWAFARDLNFFATSPIRALASHWPRGAPHAAAFR